MLGELPQLCQLGQSFAPMCPGPSSRGEESPWPRGWLWAAARPQEPPGCGQGRANLGRDNPWATWGCSPGSSLGEESTLGGQRTSLALLAGAEHNSPGGLAAVMASAGPLSLAQGPLPLGGNISAPLGFSGCCGFGGSKGLNKEVLFLVLTKFIKKHLWSWSSWLESLWQAGVALWGCLCCCCFFGGCFGVVRGDQGRDACGGWGRQGQLSPGAGVPALQPRAWRGCKELVGVKPWTHFCCS